jgi:intein/homing endonuclease
VVYELAASGITSIQDIFVSKIETGYEIKAIGNEKVYVNNIPINLPLSKYSIVKDKLLFEFVTPHES